jgi:hypothetical protein
MKVIAMIRRINSILKHIWNSIKNNLITDESTYPAVRVGDELYGVFTDGIAAAKADSGPRVRVRPPRQNQGMDASINFYETIHEPRQSAIGLGRHKLVSTSSHVHSHEMVYDEGKLQFFYKPDTRVDANQFERQLRKNYPNAQITEADKQFPKLEIGDHIAMAKMELKRPFYYPIKCKIAEEDFEVDPYGDITSDMVVEEDQTSSGERVLAEDCRVIVQTIFEPARDVWTKRRPYGRNVTDAAAKIKEGEVVGNMIEGFEVRDPGAKRSRTAKIIDKLHGAKGYYFTVRVLAISPHKEIAERRCNTVASDFEKYYNSFTEQGLNPVAIQPDEIQSHLREMAERTHTIPWLQRLKIGPGAPSVLQSVSALGSIAHIPNDDINTPVVDWAKQQTGPGIPAESQQEDDVTKQEVTTEEERRGGYASKATGATTETPGSRSLTPEKAGETAGTTTPAESGAAVGTNGAEPDESVDQSAAEPSESDSQPDTPNYRTPQQTGHEAPVDGESDDDEDDEDDINDVWGGADSNRRKS